MQHNDAGAAGLSPARRERAELAEEMLAVGPDAPTLCEGWLVQDLAVHLVVREGRPDAALGIALERIGPIARHAERVQRQFRQRPLAELVSTFQAGPPRFSAFRLPGVDNLANTVEYTIHLEDVRRAQPGWQPRDLPADLRARLAGALRLFGRSGFADSPVGVLLEESDPVGPDRGRQRVKAGVPLVVVSGPVLELLLAASGRHRHARFDVIGLDEPVAQFRAWLETR